LYKYKQYKKIENFFLERSKAKTMSVPFVTTRFNDYTFSENRTFREKHGIGCIYGPSRRMPVSIHLQSLVFVIEMNNSNDQIEGIGLIRNEIRYDKEYKVYKAGNYNRFTYASQFRLDRVVLLEYEPNIVALLDLLLFTGKAHLKRGRGFTTIPKKIFQYRDFDAETYIKQTIQKLFKRCYPHDCTHDCTTNTNTNTYTSTNTL
jgi:hypothetical protein